MRSLPKVKSFVELLYILVYLLFFSIPMTPLLLLSVCLSFVLNSGLIGPLAIHHLEPGRSHYLTIQLPDEQIDLQVHLLCGGTDNFHLMKLTWLLVLEVYGLTDSPHPALATIQHHSLHQTFTDSGILSLPSRQRTDKKGIYISFFSWGVTEFTYEIKKSSLQLLSYKDTIESKHLNILFGQYIRLYFPIAKYTKSLSIQIQPYGNCDPDIYVSLGSQPIHQVTSQWHQYRSNHWGNQSEQIVLDNKIISTCSTDCIVSIAIYGYAKGNFTLRVISNTSLSTKQEKQMIYRSIPSWITFIILLLCVFLLPVGVYMNYEQIESLMSTWLNRLKPGVQQQSQPSQYIAPNPELSQDEIVRYLSLSEENDSDSSTGYALVGSEEKMLLW